MKIDRSRKVAVVTGANRGLGLETARELARKGLQVVLTSRKLEKAEKAAQSLQAEGLEVIPFELDVTQRASILKLRDFIADQVGRLDVLVNNAGVLMDHATPGEFSDANAFRIDVDLIRQTMETNVYGPYQLCQALIPLMKKNGYGRVVNLSSGMGQLSEMNGGWPAYRISKTSINVVTRVFSQEMAGTNVLVNSVCPGWVKTDMGGPEAERTLEEGAETIVWLATLPDGGPTGGFFRDKEPIDW